MESKIKTTVVESTSEFKNLPKQKFPRDLLTSTTFHMDKRHEWEKTHLMKAGVLPKLNADQWRFVNLLCSYTNQLGAKGYQTKDVCVEPITSDDPLNRSHFVSCKTRKASAGGKLEEK